MQPPATAAPSSAPVPAPESLLEYVPASALAAAVVRSNAFEPIERYLVRNAQMRGEIAAYLERTIGTDLTKVRGAVLYATQLAPRPSVAVFLRIPGAHPLNFPKVDSFSGVDLQAIDSQDVAAVLPAGIVLGAPDAVDAEIAVSQGKRPVIGTNSPLAPLLAADIATAPFVCAASLSEIELGNKDIALALQAYGLRDAVFSVRSGALLVLAVHGDPGKLPLAKQAFSGILSLGLLGAEKEKRTAVEGNDVGGAVGAIVGYYAARDLFHEIEPTLSGDELTIRYQIPALTGAPLLIPVLGGMAAIAIPSFVKYIRRSKTEEAKANIERMKGTLLSYYVDHRSRGARFSFPPSTDWAPAGACCGSDGGKCSGSAVEFDAPTWKTLQFQIDAPHLFQYRFTSSGNGRKARFTFEARADLDCDGNYSSYRLEGWIDDAGELQTNGPIVSSPLE